MYAIYFASCESWKIVSRKKNKRKGPVKQNKKMLNRLGKAKDHEKFREKIATRISNACKVLHVKPVVSKKYGIPIG